MAENNKNSQTVAEQNTAGNGSAVAQQRQGRPCPKDCARCNFQQHAYCAAKLSFDSFTVMSQILQKLDAQTNVIADMAVRLKAIESAEAELSAPAPTQGDLFPPEK